MSTRRIGIGFWLTGSVLLVTALTAFLAWPARKHGTQVHVEPLLIYCAANLRVPLEQVIRDFQAETGLSVTAQYAGSQTMLTNAEVSKVGDLFFPADDSYIDLARTKGLLGETFAVAAMRPVVAVGKGNPKNIHSLDDLLNPPTLAQANPDAAAIGKVTRDALSKTGQWDRLKDRTKVFLATVTDVANAVKLGTVDAGIVWDTTVKQVEGLEAVEVKEFEGVEARVVVGILRSSKQPEAARRFVSYLTARDKGLSVFAKYGYTVGGTR